MKFCSDSEKCKNCEARELCQALENLVGLMESLRPAPKPDAEVKELTYDYLNHMAPALDEKYAEELYRSITFSAFQGMIAASMKTVSDLYISWEAKCEEIDKLKVQLDAQEAIYNG